MAGMKRLRPSPSDGGRLVKAAARAFQKSDTVEVDGDLMERIRSYAQQGGAQAMRELHDGLWALAMSQSSARARLCAVLVAHDLFLRSPAFRRLLCGNLLAWCELTMGTNPANPLPETDDGGMLCTTATSVLRQWHERFVPATVPLATTDYTRQLDLCFKYLRDKLHIVFAPPPDASAESAREHEVRRQHALVGATERELAELEPIVAANLTELENALNALFPSFEERFGMEDDEALLSVNVTATKEREEEEPQEDWEDEDEAGAAATAALDTDSKVGGLTDDFVIDVSIMAQAGGGGGGGGGGDVSDQEPLVRAVKDCMHLLQRSHLPKMIGWRAVFEGQHQAALRRTMQLWTRAHALMDRANKFVK